MDFSAFRRRFHRRLRERALAPSDELDRLAQELLALLRQRGDEAAPIFAELASQANASAPAIVALGEAALDARIAEPACVVALVGRAAAQGAHCRPTDEPLLRQALDPMDDAVLILDGAGGVRWQNRAAQRLLGELRSLAGRPGLEPALQALRRHAPQAATRVLVGEGEPRQCDLRAVPLSDGALVVLHDRTEELEQAAALARADRELSALHGRLVRVGSERATAEVAAGTALALNNELNAAALSLKLLRAEPAREGVARHLDVAEAALARAAALTARLGELSSPKAPGAPRSLDLNAAVLEALDLVRPELTGAARGQPARVDAHLGSLPRVHAQAVELRELLSKLLLFARDRLIAGALLELRTRSGPRGAELALTGDAAPAGDPFAEEELQLRLEAASEQAARAGGELVHDDQPNRLSLILRLPLAKPAVTPAPQPARAAARRVLVVDDDAGNRETLGELLALSGHLVDDAASADDALAAASRARPDVALVDLAMPGMNGLALAARLRAIAPGIRIALVTGWSPSSVDTNSVDAVFHKPLDPEAILAFVAELPGAPAQVS
jgi:CheY-like chemotaxis protein